MDAADGIADDALPKEVSIRVKHRDHAIVTSADDLVAGESEIPISQQRDVGHFACMKGYNRDFLSAWTRRCSVSPLTVRLILL